MPNKKGGKKFKKGKKTSNYTKNIIYKDPKEDQEYGKIIRAMGNGRFEVQCFDGKTRMGIIAGNMRKRVWVNKDDIILFSKWEFTTDDDKCSIVHKYDIDESRQLQKEGEFSDSIKLDEENEFNDDNFQFDYGTDDEEGTKEVVIKEEEEDKSMEDIWGKQCEGKLPYRHQEGINIIDIDDI